MSNKSILFLVSAFLILGSQHVRADYNMPIDADDSIEFATSRHQMAALLDYDTPKPSLMEMVDPKATHEHRATLVEIAFDQESIPGMEEPSAITKQLQEDVLTEKFFNHIAFSTQDQSKATMGRNALKKEAAVEKTKSTLELLNPYIESYFRYYPID